MRFAFAFAIIVALAACASASVFKASEYQSMFSRFLAANKRQYVSSQANAKLNIFKANIDKITLMNARAPGTYVVNNLVDMSKEEFKKSLGTFAPESTYLAMQRVKPSRGNFGGRSNTALAFVETEAEVEVEAEAEGETEGFAEIMADLDAYAEVDADTDAPNNKKPKKLSKKEAKALAEKQKREAEEKARQAEVKRLADEARAASEAKAKADAEKRAAEAAEALKKDMEAATAWANAGFDWRSKNVLNPARHQAYCGSCWAFATVAVVEAAIAIKHKIAPPVLSEQHLVDCDKTNKGCDGGWYSKSFKFAADNGVRTTEAYGTYKMSQKECRAAEVPAYKHGITGYFDASNVRNADEYDYQLIKALQKSPVAVAINADDIQFWGKKTFFIKNCTELKVNHAVVVVGTELDADGNPVWIIRNSWGTTWGDGTGHFRMERNPAENVCGLRTGAFIATMAD